MKTSIMEMLLILQLQEVTISAIEEKNPFSRNPEDMAMREKRSPRILKSTACTYPEGSRGNKKTEMSVTMKAIEKVASFFKNPIIAL